MTTLPRPCLTCGRPTQIDSRCDRHSTRTLGWEAKRTPGSYGSAWRRIRAVVLAEEPICRQCGAPSSDVDHVVNRASGGTDERANLQALCHRHHLEKTGRERTRGQGGYPDDVRPRHKTCNPRGPRAPDILPSARSASRRQPRETESEYGPLPGPSSSVGRHPGG